MSRGATVTLDSACAATFLFAAALALFLAGPKHDARARFAWTFGCALLWAHVALAFQFFHHWSHLEAIRYTAQQTARLAGVHTGVGIYLNYLFMFVWTADCVFWWKAGSLAYRHRRRAITLAIQALGLFMTFNATVVFGSGIRRWIGLVVFGGLGCFWIARRNQPAAARRVSE